MTDTDCPSAALLRKSIERHVLDIYLPYTNILKPYTQWPGYYTTGSGAVIPAVWVSGTQMVPSNWGIDGIECIIIEATSSEDRPMTGSILSVEPWDVRFKNRGFKENTEIPITLQTIRRRLTRAFPGDSVNYMSRTEATLEEISARIKLTSLVFPIP